MDYSKITLKLKSYVELIRPISAILGLFGTFVGGILGGFDNVSIKLFYAMIVVVLVTAGSMAFNDYFDRDVDKLAHPRRPIPSGRLSPKEALYFSYATFTLAVVISLFITLFNLALVLLSIALLFLYEHYFKDIGFAGNITVAFISSMALIFGGGAVGEADKAVILAVMTFLLMLGREILKDVQDIEGDKQFRTTLPMKIGRQKALYLGCILILITLALVPLPYLFHILSIWYIVVIVPASIILFYSIFIVIKDIDNIARTIEILRSGSLFALVGFVLGVLF